MAGIPNEELIAKAVITTDALAASGKLNDKQSETFLDYVIEESVLKENARVIKFRAENLNIDKIGVGGRVAFPKAEATDPGHRRGVSTSQIQLTPREIIVPFEIGDLFKEVSLESPEKIETHIIQMMARQLSNDMEELYILGDTVGPAILESEYLDNGSATQYVKDSYLALQDGWSRLADGANVVDAQGANIGLSIFGQMLRAMPTKFRRNKRALRWFLSPDLWQLYTEKLSTRATALGDSAAGGGEHGPYGVRPVEVPLWSLQPKVVQHVTLTGTTAVALRFGPISNVVVSTETLGQTPETPYAETTDWVADYTAGTIVRAGGTTIGSGDTVKVTYDANPQVLLTHMNNFVVGIGRDIKIEKDRNIYKGVNEYAIHAKVAVQFEELTAIVKGKNIGTSI